MSEIKKVYLIGLGAIGSMVASRLQSVKDCALKIIVDPERLSRYKNDGVFVNGQKYDFNYICSGEDHPQADLIIIGVKNHHLDAAIELMRPYVGNNTSLLSLLNGIESEPILGRAFNIENMIYAFYVATDALRIGNSTRYSSIGRIVFGQADASIPSPQVQAIKRLLEKADIPTEIPKDILRELWWKYMMNVSVNQTSAILKAPYGVFKKTKAARDLVRDASLEVIRIAEKRGIHLTEADIDTFLNIISNLSADNKTSMLQDVEACRKTEVEAFAGTITKLGKEYGVPTPVNDVLFKMIKTIEENYPG